MKPSELKEIQIAGSLHVSGEAPRRQQLRDRLVAMIREASLQRALAWDLGLGFDPLGCDPAAPWEGPRPEALAGPAPCRTLGDIVERLEALASELIEGARRPEPEWTRTRSVVAAVEERPPRAVSACGKAEAGCILAGVAGSCMSPVPSGAPAEHKPDVVPTGPPVHRDSTGTAQDPAFHRLIGRKELLALVPYSGVSIWRLERDGLFPRRVRIGPNRVAWRLSEVLAWIDERARSPRLLRGPAR